MSSAILNTMYNNFLTTYAPKSVTQYDTHKKSELRSVYNSIVKLNKESPWYLPDSSESTREYIVGLKENSRQLHNSIASLGDLDSGELLNKKIASSENSDYVEASFIGNFTPGSPVPTLDITVSQLASGQTNMGSFLPDTVTELNEGTYSFDVSINDLNYEFQFGISDDETNKNVQDRLVRLINNANIGIKAGLEEGDHRSSIRLTSVADGLPTDKSTIFTISDDHTSKRSGAVEYFGLNYTTHAPTNAQFTLNGEERTASSNTFTVGKMYELQIKGITPTDEPIHIGLKTDTESLADNIHTLVDGYNDFVKSATEYSSSHPRSERLVGEMSSIASYYQNNLAALGLSLNEDSTIDVDDAVLADSVADKSVVESFTSMKDFANALMRKTSAVSIDPMHYADKTVVAYKNPGHNFATPYVTSAYSGMMFNSYC